MTTYDPPTDDELAAETPITTGKAKRLRDIALAIAEGSSGAPNIIRDAISIGSSGVDGVFNDGSAPATPGIYEFSPFTLTLARTFPYLTIIRCNGDFTLSNTITVGKITNAVERRVAEGFGAISGDNGEDPGYGAFGAGYVGGGASIGDGGIGLTTTALGYALSSMSRWWALRRAIVGGIGGANSSATPGVSAGGGAFLLLVNGNCTLTGGTIDADGTSTAGTAGYETGGGGGGSVVVVCGGTLTGGTLRARGAAGLRNAAPQLASGGGGGYVATIASAYGVAPTLQVTGGAAAGGAVGANGFSEQITLTEKQINGLLFR